MVVHCPSYTAQERFCLDKMECPSHVSAADITPHITQTGLEGRGGVRKRREENREMGIRKKRYSGVEGRETENRREKGKWERYGGNRNAEDERG